MGTTHLLGVNIAFPAGTSYFLETKYRSRLSTELFLQLMNKSQAGMTHLLGMKKKSRLGNVLFLFRKYNPNRGESLLFVFSC